MAKSAIKHMMNLVRLFVLNSSIHICLSGKKGELGGDQSCKDLFGTCWITGDVSGSLLRYANCKKVANKVVAKHIQHPIRLFYCVLHR